jgi:hypothetical protein
MMIWMPTLALSSAWIKARPNSKIHLTRRNVELLSSQESCAQVILSVIRILHTPERKSHLVPVGGTMLDEAEAPANP